MDAESLLLAMREWRARVGKPGVLEGNAAQQRYGINTIGAERAIPAALLPRNVEEIVGIVAVARRHGIPLYPISTGHNWGYGSAVPVTEGCVVVDLSGLDRIVDMDAELGLVTVEPGVTQHRLHDYLERNALPFLVPVTERAPIAAWSATPSSAATASPPTPIILPRSLPSRRSCRTGASTARR